MSVMAPERALSERLNLIIVQKALALPKGYEASDSAPNEYGELLFRTALDDGKLTVWNGASDRTIYGDPRVNWAARAWHDSFHVRLEEGFSLEEEIRVANAQAGEITDESDKRLVLVDVIGQARYFAKYQEFPTDQIGFVLAYMDDEDAALSRRW